jgi:hypothetical protein
LNIRLISDYQAVQFGGKENNPFWDKNDRTLQRFEWNGGRITIVTGVDAHTFVSQYGYSN